MRLNVSKLVDSKFPKKGYDMKTNISAFAASIGVSFSAAKLIYNGKTTRIDFNTLESICRALDCTPNDIIVSDDPQLQRLLKYHQSLDRLANNSDTN